MLIYDKKFLIFFVLFISLIISFVLGENSSGGSQHDFLVTKKYIDAFQIDFFSGIQLFKIIKNHIYLFLFNNSKYIQLS